MKKLSLVQNKIREVIESHIAKRESLEESVNSDQLVTSANQASYVAEKSGDAGDHREAMKAHEKCIYHGSPSTKRYHRDMAAHHKNEMQKAMEESVNEDVVRVGSTVIPNKGPHKGIPHKVIYMHADGEHANIAPSTISPNKVKYRLGAAKVNINNDLQESIEQIDEWDVDAMRAAARERIASRSSNASREVPIAGGRRVIGTQYTGSDDDEIPTKQEAKRSTVSVSMKKGSDTVDVDGDHNIKVGHTVRGIGFPLRAKVTHVEGNKITLNKKSTQTGTVEHKFGPGAGRPSDSHSGARTHGEDGGIRSGTGEYHLSLPSSTPYFK